MGTISPNGGVNQVTVRFSQRFSEPPVVAAACGQSRVGLHVDNVSETGCYIQANNYSQNNIGSMTVNWYAIGI